MTLSTCNVGMLCLVSLLQYTFHHIFLSFHDKSHALSHPPIRLDIGALLISHEAG